MPDVIRTNADGVPWAIAALSAADVVRQLNADAHGWELRPVPHPDGHVRYQVSGRVMPLRADGTRLRARSRPFYSPVCMSAEVAMRRALAELRRLEPH